MAEVAPQVAAEMAKSKTDEEIKTSLSASIDYVYSIEPQARFPVSAPENAVRLVYECLHCMF